MKHGRCVHFTGVQNETCDMGVVYEAITDGRMGMINRLPCFKDAPERKECVYFKDPTMEEVQAYEKDMKAAMKRTVKAFAAIKEDAKGRRGVNGRIDCPNCNGKLSYSIASVNGHVWAKCETADCVAFMQ